ncbi:response regulator transcription factor [Actinoplanes sp. NPDC051411]|uniref:response regulator transcription factor n=1 Tax=Actinoplanes sp. NPDC051411 TaxID=3155522 RepID=UPI00342181A0
MLATPLSVVDVAVVTSSPLMLGGLTHVFGGLNSVRVTHQANTITDLPPAAAAVVIVTDLYGVAVDEYDYWSLAPQGAPIVALCVPDNPPNLLTAVRGGVHALVGRDSETVELVLAVRIARRGGLHVAPELFGAVTNAASPRAEPSPHNLSQREIEALRYLAGGFTHRQISRRMGLTETTVSTYVKRIRHKLHAGNKAELTRLAIELGYVDPLDRQH